MSKMQYKHEVQGYSQYTILQRQLYLTIKTLRSRKNHKFSEKMPNYLGIFITE